MRHPSGTFASTQPGSVAHADAPTRLGDFVRRWWNWEEYLAAERPDAPATFEAFEAAFLDLYAQYDIKLGGRKRVTLNAKVDGRRDGIFAVQDRILAELRKQGIV